MARKVLNRKELREESDAAERAEADSGEQEEGEAVVVEKKAPARRKSRVKTVKEVRLKAFWGVFNQSLRRVARFEYSQRKDADTKAKDLSESSKSPHFVQLVKEVLEE